MLTTQASCHTSDEYPGDQIVGIFQLQIFIWLFIIESDT